MKKLSSSVLVTACCYTSLVAAQQSSLFSTDSTTISTSHLNEILVTASRTAQSVDETLASVTLITRKDIERSQAITVAEILQKTPGVMITNSGGIGKASSIYLRGTSTKDLLILIDGIRVGSATLGQVSVEDLNLSQVERIEIVRGPRSSLYGSDAAGGVIQIFTRRGTGKLTPSFTVSAGSDGTSSVEVGVNGGDESRWYNVSASGLTTDGFDAKTSGDSDDDGYHNQGLQLKLGQRFDGGHEVEGFFSVTDSENEYDGFTDRGDTRTQVLGARSTLEIAEAWRINLSAGRSSNQSKTFSGNTFNSRYETTRDSFSVQNDLLIGDDNQLVFGVDYLNDQIESSKIYAETERDNWAGFAQYQLTLGQSDLQFSARVDDNEQFGSYTTGGIAWGMPLTDNLDMVVSYGTAFKAPSFNDLYYPNSGNAALVPEESDTYELSLRGNVQGINWQTSLYQTTFENMIAWAPDSSGDWAPSNINEARIRGLELSADYQWQQWLLSGNVSFIDPENRSGANKGNRLQRRADKIANISVDRDFGALSLGTTLHAESRRYTSDSNTSFLAGFGTVDLRASYQIAPVWQVRAKLSNLLDKEYQTVSGYNQSGSTALLTLAYQPQ
ncbi:TonB-dependent receptor domain-containing protein [Neptunomonas antarctica]|uniref:Vitamin B12 transporter n=1 Tax=Neptunomonas antarctica TaxID=619304 RepID=A0A1N7NEA5_9GAMM|nr:TonB-dependent receptor [Neptunomonas antarctica]SIS96743.1 vitamin B12 transporter [Neptunomonas antarctica]